MKKTTTATKKKILLRSRRFFTELKREKSTYSTPGSLSPHAQERESAYKETSEAESLLSRILGSMEKESSPS